MQRLIASLLITLFLHNQHYPPCDSLRSSQNPPTRSAGKYTVRHPLSTLVKNEVSEFKVMNNALHQKLADSKADNQRLKSTEVTVDSYGRGEMISRILHQTYKSSKLPANFEAWRQSCMRLNPGWEIKLWTDESNRKVSFSESLNSLIRRVFYVDVHC